MYAVAFKSRFRKSFEKILGDKWIEVNLFVLRKCEEGSVYFIHETTALLTVIVE